MKLIFMLLVVYLGYYILKSIAAKNRIGNNSGGRGYREAHSNRSVSDDISDRATGRPKRSAEEKQVQSDPGEEMVLDPVCSSYVPLSVAIKKGVGAKTVYFCSKECCDKYQD